MNKRLRNAGLYAFVAFIVVIALRTTFFDNQHQSRETARYSNFIQAVEKNQVIQVELSPDQTSALVQLFNDRQLIVNLPKDPDLIYILRQNKVDVSVVPQTDKFKLLYSLFVAVLFSTYLFFLLRRAPMSKRRRNVELLVFVAIFVVVISLGTTSFDKQPESRGIWRYSDFIQAVEQGQVEKVEISHDNSRALVTPQDTSPVNVYLPKDPDLNRILTENNVEIQVSSQTNEGLWLKALGILFSLVPLMRHLLLQRTVSNLRRDVDQIKAGSDRSQH